MGWRPMVTRLMPRRLLVFSSPTTIHQFSTLRRGKRGASTTPTSPSSSSSTSRSSFTETVTSPPASTSWSLTSKLVSMFGHALQNAATWPICSGVIWRRASLSSSSRSMMSKGDSTGGSCAAQRPTLSASKCGTCRRTLSLAQRACTTIWLSSMAARAGRKAPPELMTSTRACSSAGARSSTAFTSVRRSVGSASRDRWACSSTSAFTAGSEYEQPSGIFCGSLLASLLSCSSSPLRTGSSPYSDADESTSRRPLSFVLGVTLLAKVSTVAQRTP
mmetsp:Transcript_5980/g.20115  ORF Transcript_5980/g.20115 Transcript_5980/m.20115 type:complete len:275 (+) Transcript_5980:312-1136(+)